MSTCDALDAASFISNILSNVEIFNKIPSHYQAALNDSAFYCEVRHFVIDKNLEGIYQNGAAKQLAKVIGVMSSVFITVWVMMQGFKIMNGTMRTPILELGFQAAKMILVLTLVSLSLAETPWISEQTDMFQESIAIFFTGTSVPVDNLIDFNVATTSLIDLVVQDMTGKGGVSTPTMGSNSLTAGWLGQAGPAVMAASLLMLARVAIVFGIMLSPLFLFFILFEKTNSLFWQWAKYLLSIFFAMAALSIISIIALQAMAQYGMMVFLSMLVGQMDASNPLRAMILFVLTGGGTEVDVGGGLTRLAMMGAFLSALIVAVPAIVMTYFGSAMNLASQGLIHAFAGKHNHNPGAGSPLNNYGHGQTQNTHDLNINNASTVNQTGGGATPNLNAGADMLNHQAMNRINSAQQPVVATASRPANGMPNVGLANSAEFRSSGGVPSMERSMAAVVEAAPKAPAGVSGPSYAAVGSSAKAQPAALPGASYAYSAAPTAAAPSPNLIAANQTPVYAAPYAGSAQRSPDVIDVASREVPSRSMPVRPGGPTLVERPVERA